MAKDEIIELYGTIKDKIIARISDFRQVWNDSTEDDIFAELAFCLLTPQSKAKSADKAIKELIAKDLLLSHNEVAIAQVLNVVRFKNHKAHYLVLANDMFITENGINIKKYINKDDIIATRDYFFKNVKGFGLKEASHFLRNIGFGQNICILDRHILKNLKLNGVIDDIPKSLTPKLYYEIEKKMISFAEELDIPSEHLDFVFWYKEAGDVFK